MINFATLKALTIPQGVVKSILKDGIVLWSVRSGLPEEYQEVTYLHGRSTYATHIDLGFAFDTKAKIYMENTIVNKNTTSYTFGAAENSGALRCMLTAPYSDAGVSLYGSTGTAYMQTTFQYTENVLNHWEMILEPGKLMLTDLIRGISTSNTTQGSYAMSLNLYLFGQNYNGTARHGGSRQVGKFQYYDKNDVLICDLIPCYRKSDCKPGMYDLVKRTFLTNDGNVEFAIGPHTNIDVINQMPISTNADGSIYNNGLGYKNNHRVRSNGEEAEYSEYATCTGFIPFKKGETLEIFPAFTGSNTNNAINFFDANFNCLGQMTDDGSTYGICVGKGSIYKTTKVGNKSTLTLTDVHDSNIAYVRISHNIYKGSLIASGDAMLVTVTQTNYADPTSADWWADSYLSSSGEQRSNSDYEVTNFIGLVMNGDVVRVEGMDMTGTTAESRCAVYTTSKTVHGSFGIATMTAFNGIGTKPFTNLTLTATGAEFTVANCPDGVYWRFGGKLIGTAEDVRITITRNGEVL